MTNPNLERLVLDLHKRIRLLENRRPELRQGVVQEVHNDGEVTVRLGEDDVRIKRVASSSIQEGDAVWILAQQTDLLLIDKVSSTPMNIPFFETGVLTEDSDIVDWPFGVSFQQNGGGADEDWPFGFSTVITFRTLSGFRSFQLLMSRQGNFWYRGSDGNTGWREWYDLQPVEVTE